MNEMKSVNKCVDAEKPAGSWVLLMQHLRPSRFSGHDFRYPDCRPRIFVGFEDRHHFEIIRYRTSSRGFAGKNLTGFRKLMQLGLAVMNRQVSRNKRNKAILIM